MKKRRLLAVLLSIVMLTVLVPDYMQTFAAVAETEKEYLAFTAPDSAYINMYGNLESRYASFFDGISLGITDTTDPYYFELVYLDGLEARKQYSPNSVYISVDKEFYQEGDDLMVSIVYYDFGPSEGSYYLEYQKTNGDMYQEKLVKPGTNPGWYAKTVVATDIVMNSYDNGASFRIQNGAYNAFRKVEIVNISKHKREGTVSQIKTLGPEKIRTLAARKLIKPGSDEFAEEKLHKVASSYDIISWANKVAMNGKGVPAEASGKTMTQGELLKTFMDAMGIDYSKEENIVEYALSIGIIKKDSFFLFDKAPAITYNLASIISDVLAFEYEPGIPYVMQMFDNGFFGDLAVAELNNDMLNAIYYKTPRKNPYITITDNITGRTYKYINFFGQELMRNYLTEQSWLPDGKRFICGTRTGYLYIYNVETQLMQFYAKGVASGNDCDGIVAENGMIYYHSTMNGYNILCMVDPDDPNFESKVVYTYPKGVTTSTELISNDGTCFSGDLYDSYNFFKNPTPSELATVVVFHISEDSIPGVPDNNFDVQFYKVPNRDKGNINHFQVNPVFHELVFFAHEGNISGGYQYADIEDRSNIMNIKTGDAFNINQGVWKNNAAIQTFTHESWSFDGEYLYLIAWGNEGWPVLHDNGSLMRVRKDGTHRQYYFFPKAKPAVNINHCFPDASNKFCATDNAFASLVSLETHQIFNIAWLSATIGNLSHPYHGHAHLSWYGHIMDWGMVYKGVLGIGFYDYSEIVENEIPKGGRYKINDDVERVSYKTLDCESDEVEIDGRTAVRVKIGKEIFVAINPEIVDTVDDSVKITFDYLDNDKTPIKLTYTRGVKNPNHEATLIYNGKKIVNRRGTNKWKTATVVIDSGNFESIGRYETDFKISGGA